MPFPYDGFYDGYNNAYDTPGWTAQNQAYPSFITSGVTTPTLPDGLVSLPLTGNFCDQNGKPLWGMVRIFPSVPAVVVNGTVVALTPFPVQFVNGTLINTNGTPVSVVAPVDGAGCIPSSWNYTIHQRVGPAKTEYTITVPYPDTPVDVTAIQNLDDLLGVEQLPLTRDWILYRGADFDREFIWDQEDVLGLSEWRANLTLLNDNGEVQLVLTEEDGITLGTDSSIDIFIDDAQITALVPGPYNLTLTDPDNGDTTRFLQGRITIQ